ncbi:LVIVD repeat-containing protein [Chloroflexota bacterium]
MVQNEESKNMRLLAHDYLNGFGKGGEGFAVQKLPGGRRILYLAHESAPKDFSVLDVTDPARPKVILQMDLPHEEVRSNGLALVGDILVVPYQVARPGLTPAGMGIYDVSNPMQPKRIGFFDTSGPHSRGVHCLWFVDGRFAHLSTGAADFIPNEPSNDQFYMIVDLNDPARPTEAGRWWLPGTRQGENLYHPGLQRGVRLHNANVYPECPDRTYAGYINGGVVILDISDMSRPKMISHVYDQSPFRDSFTHTALPLFDRNLLIVAQEETQSNCSDLPMLVWVVDIQDENNPRVISSCPTPPLEDYCRRPGRFGAHNIHENEPVPTAWFSDRYIVGSFFNGGVRVYDIADPAHPEEVAYYVPPAPEGLPSIQINDIYVDEKGLVYALDRMGGGLYILEMQL